MESVCRLPRGEASTELNRGGLRSFKPELYEDLRRDSRCCRRGNGLAKQVGAPPKETQENHSADKNHHREGTQKDRLWNPCPGNSRQNESSHSLTRWPFGGLLRQAGHDVGCEIGSS